MLVWIRINVHDIYKKPVGDVKNTYVSLEVYDALMDTFRKEEHAEHMRDLRNRTAEGYVEAMTELIMEEGEVMEDIIMRRLDIETLHRAIHTLSKTQKERLHMYFFEELTIRDIAKQQHTNRNAIWKSIQSAMKKIKKFLV